MCDFEQSFLIAFSPFVALYAVLGVLLVRANIKNSAEVRKWQRLCARS